MPILRRNLLCVLLLSCFALVVEPAFVPWVVADAPVAQSKESRLDFDSDGVADSARLAPSGYLTLRLASQSERLELSRWIVGFVVEDIDHDGDRDIVALSQRGNLHVWHNNGEGQFRHERVALGAGRGGLRPSREDLTADDASDMAFEPAPRRRAGAVDVSALALVAAAGHRVIGRRHDLLPLASTRSLRSHRAPPPFASA